MCKYLSSSPCTYISVRVHPLPFHTPSSVSHSDMLASTQIRQDYFHQSHPGQTATGQCLQGCVTHHLVHPTLLCPHSSTDMHQTVADLEMNEYCHYIYVVKIRMSLLCALATCMDCDGLWVWLYPSCTCRLRLCGL